MNVPVHSIYHINGAVTEWGNGALGQCGTGFRCRKFGWREVKVTKLSTHMYITLYHCVHLLYILSTLHLYFKFI